MIFAQKSPVHAMAQTRKHKLTSQLKDKISMDADSVKTLQNSLNTIFNIFLVNATYEKIPLVTL